MNPGTLYIIASPIGNMEDITIRAIRILKEEVRIVYCEDTRQTRKLLEHYNISLPLKSLHAHSSQHRINEMIADLSSGRTLAYITDSGTPAISDPGSTAVREARGEGFKVIPIPGPSALASLVSVSGFSVTSIIFAGFLSKKESRRKRELITLQEFSGIVVIYESPYRVKKTLTAIAEVFTGAKIVIGREMTKRFEEYIAGSIDEIVADSDSIKEKGEFTIAIYNGPSKE